MITGARKTKAETPKWSLKFSRLLKACADPTRLRLLNLLASEDEVCVCHLVEVLGTNQPKVSRHLAYLKRAGLVTDRKDGLWVYYRLSSSLNKHCQRLIECLNACASEATEMQSDIHMLRHIHTHQTSPRQLRTLHQEPLSSAEPSPIEVRERPEKYYESEIQIELL